MQLRRNHKRKCGERIRCIDSGDSTYSVCNSCRVSSSYCRTNWRSGQRKVCCRTGGMERSEPCLRISQSTQTEIAFHSRCTHRYWYLGGLHPSTATNSTRGSTYEGGAVLRTSLGLPLALMLVVAMVPRSGSAIVSLHCGFQLELWFLLQSAHPWEAQSTDQQG